MQLCIDMSFGAMQGSKGQESPCGRQVSGGSSCVKGNMQGLSHLRHESVRSIKIERYFMLTNVFGTVQLKAVDGNSHVDSRFMAAVEVLKQHMPGSIKDKNMLMAHIVVDRIGEVSYAYLHTLYPRRTP